MHTSSKLYLKHRVERRREHTPGQLKAIFQRTLSLGKDMDDRGLHWTLPKEVMPEQRLAFMLAVYFTGGAYVLIDGARGLLPVEKVTQQFEMLQKARKAGSYRAGHAFAQLHEALGYGHHETQGFGLIHADDLRPVDGFIKGFSDSLAQSLEADVMRVIRPELTAGNELLINNLRHFIGDHRTLETVVDDIPDHGRGA